jgi:hypothetical protein
MAYPQQLMQQVPVKLFCSLLRNGKRAVAHLRLMVIIIFDTFYVAMLYAEDKCLDQQILFAESCYKRLPCVQGRL